MTMKTLLTIVLGLGFLYGLFTIGFPFLLAMVLAIFLEPLIRVLMKYARINRISAVTGVCSVFVLFILGSLYLLGLKIVSEFIVFAEKLPAYLKEANLFLQDTISRTQLFYETLPQDMAFQLQQNAEAGISALMESLNGLLGGVSGSFLQVAKSIPNLFIVFVVFLVALYLFSYSLPTLKGSFLSLFEDSSREKVDKVLSDLRSAIFGFLRAQLIISALTYVVALAGLIILQADFVLAIAFLIVVVDILPILGTGSVLVPWALYSLLTGNTFLGVGLLLLFLVITIFRRIIEPKILGDSVGIGALSALISLFIGFQLVGVVGLFLGPIVVIIYQAMRKAGLLQIKIKFE